jgi:hypothetical protein
MFSVKFFFEFVRAQKRSTDVEHRRYQCSISDVCVLKMKAIKQALKGIGFHSAALLCSETSFQSGMIADSILFPPET